MSDYISILEARVKQLEHACAQQDEEVCQDLGKVLGYPWYKDDQKNFPGATEKDGVCVGEHVAESIAMEAANYIVKLREQLQECWQLLKGIRDNTLTNWWDREADILLRSHGQMK